MEPSSIVVEVIFEELLEPGCFGPHPPTFAGAGSVLCETVWEVLDCLGLHPLAFMVLVLLVLDMEASPEALGCLGLHPLAFMVAALPEEVELTELLNCFGATDSPLLVDGTLLEEEEILLEALGCLELHPPPVVVVETLHAGDLALNAGLF